MIIEQYVMAYRVEQDRIRALLPSGFESLRPVLRINAEVRGSDAYVEFNTPVSFHDKKGWLNIDNWKTPQTNISVEKNGKSTTFRTDFLEITYTAVGIEGKCPAEKDNDGCFYIGEETVLVPPEAITSNKEFCDCTFAWKFDADDAHGVSSGGKTLPALPDIAVNNYPKQTLTARIAAAIPCDQMLGQYKVLFER